MKGAPGVAGNGITRNLKDRSALPLVPGIDGRQITHPVVFTRAHDLPIAPHDMLLHSRSHMLAVENRVDVDLGVKIGTA